MGQLILITVINLLLMNKFALSKMKHFDVKSTTTVVSEAVELSCTSTSSWFFCVWEGPRGDRVCALRSNMGKGDDSMCGENKRFQIRGKKIILFHIFY